LDEEPTYCKASTYTGQQNTEKRRHAGFESSVRAVQVMHSLYRAISGSGPINM